MLGQRSPRVDRGIAAEQLIETIGETIVRDLAEELVLGHSFRDRVFRQEDLAQAHAGATARRDHHAVLERLGDVGEELGHLFGRLQILLFAVAPLAPGIFQRLAFTDRDPRFVGPEILALEKADVVGRYHRYAALAGQPHRMVHALFVVLAAGTLQFQIEAAGEVLLPLRQQLACRVDVLSDQKPADLPFPGAGQRDQPFALFEDPGLVEDCHVLALTFSPGSRDQLGQVAIAGIVHRQQRQTIGMAFVVRIVQPQVGADDRLQPGALGCLVDLDQAEQVGVVGHGHRRHAGLGRCLDQRLEPDQAIDEGVFAVDTKMNEGCCHDELESGGE